MYVTIVSTNALFRERRQYRRKERVRRNCTSLSEQVRTHEDCFASFRERRQYQRKDQQRLYRTSLGGQRRTHRDCFASSRKRRDDRRKKPIKDG